MNKLSQYILVALASISLVSCGGYRYNRKAMERSSKQLGYSVSGRTPEGKQIDSSCQSDCTAKYSQDFCTSKCSY